jgi:exopolysaccharide biosynthesis WecB/TagA/CpsF family protein
MTVHPALPFFAPPPPRDILGTAVTPISEGEAVALLEGRIAEKRFTRVGFLNAHNANLTARDPAFASTLRGFVVLPDGIGVDLASKLLYGAPFPDNLNGTDFVPAFFQAVARPLTVALIGTTRDNAERAAARFGELAPQHRFVFLHDGFFNNGQEQAILDSIRAMRPDVLLVAMGVPRQELWIANKITAEHCTVAIAVGALLDFMSGAVPRAPGWVRKLRMEWIYRLAVEPRRLFVRYILGNPVFLLRVLRQRLAQRKTG